MPKLKTFIVGVWEEQGGYLTVKAHNREEAEEIALGIVDDVGLGFEADLPPHTTLRITHRDYSTTDCIEGGKDNA